MALPVFAAAAGAYVGCSLMNMWSSRQIRKKYSKKLAEAMENLEKNQAQRSQNAFQQTQEFFNGEAQRMNEEAIRKMQQRQSEILRAAGL